MSGEKSWGGDDGGGQEPEGQRSGKAGGKRGEKVLDREEGKDGGSAECFIERTGGQVRERKKA